MDLSSFLAEQTHDSVIEQRICRRCASAFSCFAKDDEMHTKLAPVISGETFSLPSPDLCRACRERNKMLFRKERWLYKRVCDGCKKTFVSVFPQEYPGKVLCHACWYNPAIYDPTTYGREISLTEPLLPQLQRLAAETPALGIFQSDDIENSDYAQHIAACKGCYLCGAITNSEKCFYTFATARADTTIDCSFLTDTEVVYDSIDIVNARRVFFSSSVKNSSFVRFSNAIENANYVLLSAGVHNAQYVYKNQSLPKDEREMHLHEVQQKLTTPTGLQELWHEFSDVVVTSTRVASVCVGSENCVGHEITNSGDVFFGFDCTDVKDARYVRYCRSAETLMDVYGAYNKTDKTYNSAAIGGPGGASNVYSSYLTRDSHHVYHSYVSITNAAYCALSIGMTNKQYCILNKQYTKQEWEDMMKKLVPVMQAQGLRGSFLDPTVSYFPYNDTIANDYYPIYKIIQNGQETIVNPNGQGTVTIHEPEKLWAKATLDLGGETKIPILRRTKHTDPQIPAGVEIINGRDIVDVSDDAILNKVIICAISGRPYRILPAELAFYRTYGISLPHIHPDERFNQRMARRIPRKLSLASCAKCGKEIVSVYTIYVSPDKGRCPEGGGVCYHHHQKIYCAACYAKEIS